MERLVCKAHADSDGGKFSSFSHTHSRSHKTQAKDVKPDFVSHLVDNTPDDAAGLRLLYGESRLIITAGGETTSTALTFIFIHLATRPKYMYALRKELQANASNFNSQRPLPLLDAIINESMRMWPSVFLYSPRATPPEGLTINGHYIPGNMIVQIPPFAMFHDPRHFVQPDVFIPERWLDRPELVLRKDAFNPFMMGPYNCAGKSMAMMELRSVVSGVIREFDVLMPEGFDEEKYWNGVKDVATAGAPRQDVMFARVIGE
jgi:cytochrome P450